jgi:hypothetical protein
MYFINELHKSNYEHLVNELYPHAKEDREYHVIAYIFALPDIYTRCIQDNFLNSYPFLWTVKYKDTSYFEQDKQAG